MTSGSGFQSLVSVVIPTYNRAGMICEALDSVMQQSYTPCEVIVVDDGSTDDTKNAVARYGDRVRYDYQRNEGPASARNRGLKASTGEYVVFIDSDDLMLPTKISEQLRILESNPDLDFCHSGWQLVDRDLRPIETIVPWHLTAELDLQGCLVSHPFYLPAIMFRARSLRRVGGFRPELRQSEDIDLILRVLLKGSRGAWLKRPTVLYRQHQDSLIRRTRERIEYGNRVFASFFANKDLPANIIAMERIFRYKLLLWFVWELYRNGEYDPIPSYLQQSMEFFEGTRQEIMRSWVKCIWQRNQTEKRSRGDYDLREFLPLCKAAIELDNSRHSGSHNVCE